MYVFGSVVFIPMHDLDLAYDYLCEAAFNDLAAPVRRLCSPDVPSVPFAPPLEAELSIGADEIASALRALLDA